MRFLLIVCISLAIVGLGQAVELKSRAIDNFFCNDLLNQQIHKEFNASQTYLALANYFSHDTVALSGFAKKFMADSNEEREHGQKLMNYVIKRGGRVCTPSVQTPPNDAEWSDFTVCTILEKVIEMEKDVNSHLLKVHKCARGEVDTSDKNLCSPSQERRSSHDSTKLSCSLSCETNSGNTNGEDPQLQDFLEGEFLKEQVDSVKNLADLLTKLERATIVPGSKPSTFTCNGLGLFIIDKEL